MTTVLGFAIGDRVRRKEAWGRGKAGEIIDIGPCSKWCVDPPYYHSCEDQSAIVVLEGNRQIVAHSEMYELIE